jgi:FdhD protein
MAGKTFDPAKELTPPWPVVETRLAQQWRLDGSVESVARSVPDEAAIGLAYDSKPHVVLMGAPSDIIDLAIGFTFSEGIAKPSEIDDISVTARPEGVLVDMLLSPSARDGVAKARARALEGRTSCGLCGVQHLAAATRKLPRVEGDLQIARSAIQHALAQLEKEQTQGRATRATHAAAWIDRSGRLLLLREDVGRHNALDKLIGAALRAKKDPRQSFIVVTSRLSYEMVEKTAIAGVSILVAISAPTGLAIRKAEEAGITLIGLARPDGHTIFTRPDRVIDEPIAAKQTA